MENCKTVISLCNEKFESCGDMGLNISGLLSSELSATTTVKEFDNILYTELIDAKSRKTISDYPTLRVLYERYRDGFQATPNSSAYDYITMGNFTKLVGDYWIDLIEQVIPSTTIWGSTFTYRNTIFDNNKFKYKKYTLFTCGLTPNIIYPSPTSGDNTTVEVIQYDLSVPDYVGPECLAPSGETTICGGVSIRQIDHGSEFVGSVTVVGDGSVTTGDTTVVNECVLSITGFLTSPETVIGNDATATVNISGALGPITYLWSNGATTQTITGLAAGTYSVTVTDTGIDGCTATASVTIGALG